MRMIFAIGAMGAAFALAAVAQDATADQQKAKLKVELDQMIQGARVMNVEAMVMGSVVKDLPYSADEIHETTQTLADGTRIHNEVTTQVARDSAGRVRRETGGSVTIWNPVDGTSVTTRRATGASQPGVATVPTQMMYVMTKKVTSSSTGTAESGGEHNVFSYTTGTAGNSGGAFRVGANGAMSVGGPQAMTVTGFATKLDGEGKRETLEPQIVEGLKAEGARTTHTLETNTIGNDRPIQIVEERWISPELQIPVMTRRVDPRTGEDIVKLTNVRRLEPDPSLFVTPQRKSDKE